MATTPPTEVPPPPSQPGQPEPLGPDITTPGPDIDIPAPQPGGDPGGAPAQPIGFAMPSSSNTGERSAGDTDDIGSTASMGAAHGDLAGTSR
jgi:hypothetical protein